ncbi:MAG TPA: adenylate/guanylate cyclase domain-containing protein [Candidatus Dormibacteraeota bacterium]|nr:adenylate/guanylate cyclase domain-containing protein [Candidatus Dormibacteraeota bacterium]
MAGLPEGTLTFLLTDVVGSTQAWEKRPEAMRAALEQHDRVLNECVKAKRGSVVEAGREGDSILAVFTSASDAAASALQMQEGLSAEEWPEGAQVKVRIALLTGVAELRADHYYGQALNRCARLLAAAHGGQILMGGTTASLLGGQPPPGSSIRDLGHHRFKDLLRAEHVYELAAEGREPFPAIESLEKSSNNLPVQLSSFVGRDKEVRHVVAILGSARLVTLTGAGGCGKTRLALQVAAELLDENPDGTWFADLSTLSDGALVPSAVAAAASIQEQRNRPVIDTLVEALAHRRLLLVMDNCEHLVDACAELADRLLRAAPKVRILTTSREALRVPGERSWPVGPLNRNDAVSLFVERATAGLPSFRLDEANSEAVYTLCERLDRLPLAIELAAARVGAMEPQEIVDRLGAAFSFLTGGSRTAVARQRTLRAVIDWGYELLEPDEKKLLRRVAIFAGPFSTSAADTVCAFGQIEGSRLLEPLTGLVAKSFVAPEEGRFRCLDTIRLYGRERLTELGELADMQVRHADWLVALSADRAPGELAGWLNRLESVHDEIRAALSWAGEADSNRGLTLCQALRQWWQVRGHVTEARQFLERLLAKAEESPAQRACLEVAAGLAYEQGDMSRAHDYLDRAIEQSRRFGDKTNLVQALDTRSLVLTAGGQPEASESAADEALRLAREVGDAALESHCLYQLGLLMSLRGDLVGSIARFEESLELLRLVGRDDEGLASMVFLGITLLFTGDLDRARTTLTLGVKLSRTQGDRRVAWALDGLAWLAATEGQGERALTLAGAAAEIFAAAGRRPPGTWSALLEHRLEPVRGSIGEKAAAEAFAAGRNMDFAAALDYALEVPHIARYQNAAGGERFGGP